MEHKLFNNLKRRGPLKINGFKFLGQHPDYQDIFYYVKELRLHNYEFMEARLERTGLFKYSFTAGTNVVILDTFMYFYIDNKLKDIKYNAKTFLSDCFNVLDKEYGKDATKIMKQVYDTKIPLELKKDKEYQKAIEEGFKVLYTCNTELNTSQKTQFNQVNVILYKNDNLTGFGIDREFTIFRPLFYMVKPSYVKGEGKDKYNCLKHKDINICINLFK